MSEITETRWVTREQSRILTNLRSRVRRQRSTSAMARAVRKTWQTAQSVSQRSPRSELVG